MVNFCSSQKASRASWTLRLMVRSGVKKTFLATCWVIVLPPWTTSPGAQVDHEGAQHAEDIHAAMIEEAAVLSRDDGLDKAGGNVFERNDLAAKVTVGRKNPVG